MSEPLELSAPFIDDGIYEGHASWPRRNAAAQAGRPAPEPAIGATTWASFSGVTHP